MQSKENQPTSLSKSEKFLKHAPKVAYTLSALGITGSITLTVDALVYNSSFFNQFPENQSKIEEVPEQKSEYRLEPDSKSYNKEIELLTAASMGALSTSLIFAGITADAINRKRKRSPKPVRIF